MVSNPTHRAGSHWIWLAGLLFLGGVAVFFAHSARSSAPAGALFVFTDDRLESQGGLEKQLLRMGARNTRLLQREARDIAAALGLPLRSGATAAATR